MYTLRRPHNNISTTIKLPKLPKTRKIFVGILTMPHEAPVKHGNAHIMKSYVDWFEKRGVSVVPIPYNTKNCEWYFNNINGLLIPGGEHDYIFKNKRFIKTCHTFIKLSITENKYFPIWGTCLGFQMLVSIIGDIKRFDKYDAVGYFPIKLTKYAPKSRMFKYFSKSYMNFLESPSGTLNNHHHGLTPDRFSNNKLLCDFFKVIAIGKDSTNREFITCIEARNYPIYGVQWHPERQGADGIPFLNFFISELSKNIVNSQIISSSISRILKPKKCSQYPELGDQECYFFTV